MRLSPELIAKAPQFQNTVRDREIDLRGCRIPDIENLGATLDRFDTIDLTDNEITRLENFPLLKRLGTLLLSNNRVDYVSPSVGNSLPNLHTLVLSNNFVSALDVVDSLESLSSLRSLSFMRNPVAKMDDYRLYCIWKLPQLRVLDFRKIKKSEREAAIQRFGERKATKGPKVDVGEEARRIARVEERREVDEGVRGEEGQKPQLAPEILSRILEEIRSASSMERVLELEACLAEGRIPPDMM
jgi:U2 small nuclear ribonucleoprotein A'